MFAELVTSQYTAEASPTSNLDWQPSQQVANLFCRALVRLYTNWPCLVASHFLGYVGSVVHDLAWTGSALWKSVSQLSRRKLRGLEQERSKTRKHLSHLCEKFPLHMGKTQHEKLLSTEAARAVRGNHERGHSWQVSGKARTSSSVESIEAALKSSCKVRSWGWVPCKSLS